MDMSTEEEAQLIRYMLNDLPQEECERIEEMYFKDDAYFEALAALETQLVRDWLAGSLTPKQAEQFEARMRDWWIENAERREPHPKAEPEEFGLDLNAIRPLFANYVEHSQRWLAH